MKFLVFFFSFLACLQYHAQNAQLVAKYNFDSNTFDVSGNNNHGTCAGPMYVTDRFGNNSKALFFTGSTEVSIQDAPSMNPSTGITVSTWYKAESFSGGGYSPFVDKGFTSHSAPYYQYKLGVVGNNYPNSPGRFGFSVSINGLLYSLFTPNNFWTVGNWYLVTGTYDGTTLCLYVNAVLISSLNVSGTLSTFATNIKAGNNTTANDFLAGTLDDLRIYNYGLTSEQVYQIYIETEVKTNLSENSDLVKEQYNLWPIPAKNSVNVSSTSAGVTSATLLDIEGRVLERFSFKSNYLLDLSALHSGIYYLQLASEKGTKPEILKITK